MILRKKYLLLSNLAIVFLLLLYSLAIACGGVNVILDDKPSESAFKKISTSRGHMYFDRNGNLLFNRSKVKISPARAEAIVNKFVREKVPYLKRGFKFRKLELVHGRLIYQYESIDQLSGYNGKYHLGPVNFIVDHLILDVDALTGELFIANGCGAAPGQLLARYNPEDIHEVEQLKYGPYISDDTNFIARNTGNTIKIDGIISEDEWKNTGHRYFYIGEFSPHKQNQPHKKPFYHVEIWSQISNGNIYFAVKTDTPYWIGLLFKDDPNLGMLWSYKDAKVLKSNGEITDRHFIQRQNGTFFLKRDRMDNIIAASSRQDNLYTYEFAFPLNTGDREDIEFIKGRAYNMLVVVGNTLEHYGIFTMDPAHKNHAHSKNNKEHADVWASNETTLRIGTPPQTDIFGNKAEPSFTTYVSGLDPSRNETHYHYAGHITSGISNRALLVNYINISTIFIGLLGMAFLFIKTKDTRIDTSRKTKDVDLFRYQALKGLVSSKYYRSIFTIPVLLIFIVIIFAGALDTQDGRQNIATVYTWTLWWSLIIFSFILFGRLWCMMCPFAFIGDIAQRFISLKKRLPQWLQNMGFQIIAFVALTFAYAHYSLYQKPFATSLLILGILVASVMVSIIFQRRTFCRYICPIGAVIGLYSLISPFKITSNSKIKCTNHRSKTCSSTCPMLEDPYNLDSNLYCNFCMKCLHSCPGNNLSIKYRGFGRDIINGMRRSSIEAMASLILFGIVLFETLSMTSAFPQIKKYLAGLLGIYTSGTTIFSITYIIIITLPALLFIIFCYGLSRWIVKEEISAKLLIKELAFPFIPLGIGLHLAHNMNHLFVEAPVAVPATIRLLRKVGLFSSYSINWNPMPIIGSKLAFTLQMLSIVSGFIFALYLLYKTLKRLNITFYSMAKIALTMVIYAVITVTVTFYMIGLPMNGRHIH